MHRNALPNARISDLQSCVEPDTPTAAAVRGAAIASERPARQSGPGLFLPLDKTVYISVLARMFYLVAARFCCGNASTPFPPAQGYVEMWVTAPGPVAHVQGGPSPPAPWPIWPGVGHRPRPRGPSVRAAVKW